MSEKLTLFDRFGGTRKMADMLGEAPSTVQSWKGAGRIPAGHQPKVLETARGEGIEITAEDIIFPMGREFIDTDHFVSATNGDGNIPSKMEADSPRPFCPISSGTAGSPAPAGPSLSPCSSGPASPPEPKAEAA